MKRVQRAVRREHAKTEARRRKRAQWDQVCCQHCITVLGLPGRYKNADHPRPTARAKALADQAEGQSFG